MLRTKIIKCQNVLKNSNAGIVVYIQYNCVNIAFIQPLYQSQIDTVWVIFALLIKTHNKTFKPIYKKSSVVIETVCHAVIS